MSAHKHTVLYEGREQPQDEVASLLLCAGLTEQKVLDFFERRLQVGRFANSHKVVTDLGDLIDECRICFKEAGDCPHTKEGEEEFNAY